MTRTEAEKKRPCCLCKHYERCQVVDFPYSPCWNTDKDGKDHHGAFELDLNKNKETE